MSDKKLLDKVSFDRFSIFIDYKPKGTIEVKWKRIFHLTSTNGQQKIGSQ